MSMSAALRFKQAITQQLSPLLECSPDTINPLFRAAKKQGQLSLSLKKYTETLRVQGQTGIPDPLSLSRTVAEKFVPNDKIVGAQAEGANLHFSYHPANFTQDVLHQVYHERDQYGWAHVTRQEKQPTVVIDYSSPNIAKPFHAGHLRSTILGNFVKNIHTVMGYRAIGINYLGDWGKQYGLLAVGYERYGDEAKLLADPIHHLYDVYVRINKDASEDAAIDAAANAYFKRMEEGDESALTQWRRFRELSIASYADIYARLGIVFDSYSGESETNDYIPRIQAMLRDKNLIRKTDGASVIDLEAEGLGSPPVQRADGTSLYLTRDLATLLMRREKYGFDRAIYVVGTEQQVHFRQVFAAARHLFGNLDLQHVNFGRIVGMSTRQGTAVFLQDILDKAKSMILEYTLQKPSGLSVHQVADAVADPLGVSAIMIQDMKAKRTKNYTFAWDRMTDARGDTGVFLQYAHARACGIERKAGVPLVPEIKAELLAEPEAFELAQLMAAFPELVDTSFQTLEPCTIVNYLYKLAHGISLASAKLRVKDMDPDTAQARLLLFWSAKTTLANGLNLLGIKPLEEM
ncbi:arginyl-tRNA synthetase [Syncephalastrum racemosum]|uniref:arginine--tRNA ligase n=1 Tax=Syncephalastrum racemosum TaxID=13706 RepID=A0A1X2H8X5_SYNRA|nr:arginyl-tRNA synthetase [Syncephalastrum racemosum]